LPARSTTKVAGSSCFRSGLVVAQPERFRIFAPQRLLKQEPVYGVFCDLGRSTRGQRERTDVSPVIAQATGWLFVRPELKHVPRMRVVLDVLAAAYRANPTAGSH
jgi:hypothetical protein